MNKKKPKSSYLLLSFFTITVVVVVVVAFVVAVDANAEADADKNVKEIPRRPAGPTLLLERHSTAALLLTLWLLIFEAPIGE